MAFPAFPDTCRVCPTATANYGETIQLNEKQKEHCATAYKNAKWMITHASMVKASPVCARTLAVPRSPI